MPSPSRPDARLVCLDDDWLDTICEALIRTGRPGLAEAFTGKWANAPADPAEAVAEVCRMRYAYPQPYNRNTARDVLRALGAPTVTPIQQNPST